ncbi:MAG: glycosyltransferase, partial [Candidatus Glassbacteria bacterium]|nr:glycosyltransferase [Candidatus Glassbacteria bacterium]
MAADDPEGAMVYERISRKARKLIEQKDLILINVENEILVNALQRCSSVIVQKSLMEGFGLTVAEALWKETPVVASKVGGIPLQIKNGESGFLLDARDSEGFAEKILHILKYPELGREMGRKGRQVVQEKYLITRLISDYLDMFIEIL